jgi:hypothetical protein
MLAQHSTTISYQHLHHHYHHQLLINFVFHFLNNTSFSCIGKHGFACFVVYSFQALSYLFWPTNPDVTRLSKIEHGPHKKWQRKTVVVRSGP